MSLCALLKFNPLMQLAKHCFNAPHLHGQRGPNKIPALSVNYVHAALSGAAADDAAAAGQKESLHHACTLAIAWPRASLCPSDLAQTCVKYNPTSNLNAIFTFQSR